MKRLKRMIAVLLLTATVLVIGYLVYTGSRMTPTEEKTSYTEALYEQTESI